MKQPALMLGALAITVCTGCNMSDGEEGVEARVEALVAAMTLDEKIEYIGGYEGFNIRPVPRLGLPEIVLTDGPAGVRNFGPSTAYPAPITLAAAWDVELARDFGAAIARDCRARGVHVWLGPGMNLTRQPQGGRNFEYFGEDPYLTTRTAVNVVNGVQAGGVVATAKHYIANEQEQERHTASSDVDERTLREVYMQPFEACVREARVGAVMSSYNLINGVHASEHRWLLTDVLKGEWGFSGPVMSDWTSVYSTLGPVSAGLDLEMPSAEFMSAARITPLIESGQVRVAQIDDKVRRIIRMIVSHGFLDRPQRDPSIPLNDPTSDAVALRIAREGMVLLRNEHGALPLDRASVRRIVVTGPCAHPAVTGAGGSSYTEPFKAVSMLEALREVAGAGVKVEWVPAGLDPDARAFAFDAYQQPDRDEPGLRAEYFANRELSGAPVVTRTEARIDFDWRAEPAPGVPTDNFSVRWTGRFTPAASGDYQFVGRSDDGLRVFLDDQPVVDIWRDQASTREGATRRLEAGRTYRLRVEYYEAKGAALAHFGIVPVAGASEPAIDPAVISGADAVIACVGFGPDIEGEGTDRPFALPPEQERLLRELVTAHPRVIVVLNAGASVDARAWFGRTAGVLMAWYPGQNGCRAAAEILWGDVNPSGKLPVTFERDFAESYAADDHPPVKDGRIAYSEGVFVGYRHYDRAGLEPLLPFGFGLSYTTFTYSDMDVELLLNQQGTTAGTLATPIANATATVTNAGRRAGDEVVQLYVDARSATANVPRPVRTLCGFQRVHLAAGESKRVQFTVTARELAYFDTSAHAWRTGSGEYTLHAGGSSRDLPLRATIRMPVAAMFTP